MKSIAYMLALLTFLMFTEKVQAQTAHLYQDSIYFQLLGYTSKMNKLTQDRIAYEQEIKEMQASLNEKAQTLTAVYHYQEGESNEQLKARMSAKDVQKLNFLEEENKLLEKRIASYNKLLDEQYSSDILPFVDLVNRTIEAYAIKNKLDYVWLMDQLKNSLAYANKGKDITGIIVKLVNEELEKKSPSSTPHN